MEVGPQGREIGCQLGDAVPDLGRAGAPVLGDGVQEMVLLLLEENGLLLAIDHPFQDEVIHSLEGLQKELTGLYSKRQFNVLYQVQLKRKTLGETYSVVVFTLEEMDVFIPRLGHEAAQEAIRRMGVYIDKHFGARGGYSTRRHSNEFVTVLPSSDLTEVESMLKDFVDDFQEKGIQCIFAGARKEAASKAGVEFSILAGIAQGEPIMEIGPVIDTAKHQQKEIARLRCHVRR